MDDLVDDLLPPRQWVSLGARRAFAVAAGIVVFTYAVDMPVDGWDNATIAATLFVAMITLGGVISGALAAALQRLIEPPKMAALAAIAVTGWLALAVSPLVHIGSAPWTANLAWWLVMIGVPAALGMIVVLATNFSPTRANVPG